MGRYTIREVRDELGHHDKGLGRVETPSGWSGTVQDTLREVRDGSGHPEEGWGPVGTP